MEWEAYSQLEPFDELRADYRVASIVQMIFNMAVSVKDRKPLSEFLLKWEEEPKAPQTFEEQIAIAKIWAATQASLVKERAKD